MPLEALSRVSLCRGLGAGASARLLALARERRWAAGERLVRQNEPARGAVIIAEGEVALQVALPGGQALEVGRLAAGDIFGEMALLEAGRCSASAVAVGAVRGWFLGRDEFRALVATREPEALELQRALMRDLLAKLRALNGRALAHAAPEDRPARRALPAADPLAGVARRERADFDLEAFLPRLPFFSGFDAEEVAALAAEARLLELPHGAWLFVQGQPAEACFLVVRGAVEVLARARDRERRVAIAGPGELVGHLALLEGCAHGASACMREAGWLLEWPRATFLRRCDGADALALRLVRAVQASLLRALARTNTLLVRLIAHAQLTAAHAEAAALAAELYGQGWQAEPARS